ncbi:MAG: hypothetical protein KIT11_02465 [Fimbriimonadaceae bacterium]|nr:hypothetical protein [Fimbriimonadaceae bacterium]QYK54769.1 MAG: hypothetical protein KF733_07070 [Fimbriimonadaceae bacterium]
MKRAASPLKGHHQLIGRLAAALALAGALVPAVTAQKYIVQRIGFPPGQQYGGVARLNNSGACLVKGVGARGFYWTAQIGFLPLPSQREVPGQNEAEVTQNGTVFYSDRDSAAQFSAAEWRPGQQAVFRRVPGSQYTEVYGANQAGQFVGRGVRSDQELPYIFTPTQGFRQIETLPGYPGGQGLDINDRGEVSVDNRSLVDTQPGLWTAQGGMRDLGQPPGTDQVAGYRINALGQIGGPAKLFLTVFGWVWDPTEGPRVVYSEGPRGEWTPLGFNDQGHLAGLHPITLDPYVVEPYLWRPEWERARRLNDMLAPGQGPIRVNSIVCINEKGWIGGNARYDGGEMEPVIVKPETSPLSVKAVQVATGRLLGGDTASLSSVDGDSLRVARFIVPNAKAPAVSLVLEGAAPRDLLYSWLKVRARAQGSSDASLRIDLYDWTEQRWDEEFGTATPLDGWTDAECVGRRPNKHFRGPDGTVRARVLVTGPLGGPAWSLELDYAEWEATLSEQR